MSKNDNGSHVKEQSVLQAIFCKKHDDAKVSKLFKTPRVWGALLGELIGTMLLAIIFLTTIGVIRADLVPLYLFGAVVAIYAAIYNLSGAHLNPLITAGAMATRKISVVKGLLYIVAQFIGAWLGLLVIVLFRNGSGSPLEIPVELIEVDSTSFLSVALIELMCAIILGFMFTRASSKIKKNKALSYAMVMACCVSFIFLLSIIISQSYFGLYASLVFNPAIASVYPIFSNLAGGVGQVALILLTYFIIPIVGGIVGTILSDLATHLVGDGYTLYDDEN